MCAVGRDEGDAADDPRAQHVWPARSRPATDGTPARLVRTLALSSLVLLLPKLILVDGQAPTPLSLGLPGMGFTKPGGNVHLDVLMGRDEEITPEDVLIGAFLAFPPFELV